MSMTQETLRPAFSDKKLPLIIYGIPFDQASLKHIKSMFNKSRVYIIAANSIAKSTNALTTLQHTLDSLVVGTRIGMKPHTLFSEVFQILDEVRKLHADIIITLGGGTLSYAAKVIAFAHANNVHTCQELAQLPNSFSTPQLKDAKAPTIPIICIPTSLSGGEYSDAGGATDDIDNIDLKYQFLPPLLGPPLVILDADLACSTPKTLWLPSGFRVIDHCIETLGSLESDTLSENDASIGLKALLPGLLGSNGQPDAEARHKCQIGVAHSMAFLARGVHLGASHGIGHMLGPMGVGHGETSCILLPAVCKYNVKYGGDKVSQRQHVALDIIWGDDFVRRVLEKRGLVMGEADLGDTLDVVVRQLGSPRTLREVGVGREKMGRLAENSLKDYWCHSNAVPLERKEDVTEILEMVVE